jgi:CRISPR-associated exonuclease Cas4
LTGRPDYLVQENGAIIPVEVKSGRAPGLPYDSHIFQLAAYCLLVESTYGKAPPYGLLRYRDRTFSIDYSPSLQKELEDLLEAIRRQERSGEADRSHQDPARCARCGYRNICNQRL